MHDFRFEDIKNAMVEDDRRLGKIKAVMGVTALVLLMLTLVAYVYGYFFVAAMLQTFCAIAVGMFANLAYRLR